MKIEKKSTQGLNSVYSVSFSSDFIATEKKMLLDQHAKKYKKPGFRPGKVPLAVVEKEFGAAATQQILDNQLNKANEKIIKENNLNISMRPNVKAITEDLDQEMVFEFSYESMPVFELQDFSNIQLEKITRAVDEKEFKAAFENFIDKRAPFNAVNKKVKPDHIVTVALSMSLDGEAISDIQDRTFYLCPANDKALYPAVAQALIGTKINDAGSVEEQLDDTFPLSQVRGKKVTIQYVVKNVEEKEKITEDNLEFFKNNGFESVEDAKKQVKEQLENEVAQNSRLYLKRKLFDQLNTVYTFELPASIVSVEEKSIREQMNDADEADQDVSDEEIKSIAERRVRLGLIIGEIAKKFDLKPTQEDIGKKIVPYLYSMGMEPQKAYEKLIKNQRFMNIIHSEALEDVAVDYMLSKVMMTEKALSKSEFEKELHEILPE